MIFPRNQLSGAFWITVAVLVVLVGYPLSIGPVRWLYRHNWFTNNGAVFSTMVRIYRPVTWLEEYGPQPIPDAMTWYGQLWF